MEATLIKTEGNFLLVLDGVSDAFPHFLTSTYGNVIADLVGNDIHELSLENCESIAKEFDLDELARKRFGNNTYNTNNRKAFIEGFQKRDEILSDKIFNEDDLIDFSRFRDDYFQKSNTLEEFTISDKELIDKYKEHKSKQEKRFKVEIEMEKYGRCEGCLEAGIWHCSHADSCGNAIELQRPKLDENDCLMLKRK